MLGLPRALKHGSISNLPKLLFSTSCMSCQCHYNVSIDAQLCASIRIFHRFASKSAENWHCDKEGHPDLLRIINNRRKLGTCFSSTLANRRYANLFTRSGIRKCRRGVEWYMLRERIDGDSMHNTPSEFVMNHRYQYLLLITRNRKSSDNANILSISEEKTERNRLSCHRLKQLQLQLDAIGTWPDLTYCRSEEMDHYRHGMNLSVYLFPLQNLT